MRRHVVTDPDDLTRSDRPQPDEIGPEGAPYDAPETENIEEEGDPPGGNFA